MRRSSNGAEGDKCLQNLKTAFKKAEVMIIIMKTQMHLIDNIRQPSSISSMRNQLL